MQFYVIVPLLFRFLFVVPRGIVYIPCLLLAAASLALQATSTEKVAFGFLFCRIWQFMAGIVAFFFVNAVNTDKDASVPSDHDVAEGRQSEQFTKVLLSDLRVAYADSSAQLLKNTVRGTLSFMSTLALIAVLAVPLQVPVLLCRVAVVLLSGCLLVVGAGRQNVLLDNRVFVWIGDASYTLYLVHWPIIVFFKYLSVETRFGLIGE
ncbi:Protein OAC-36 [Aphelenchoides avenae]|nr:Protein OAC-36 [Aphelenchus avenae]